MAVAIQHPNNPTLDEVDRIVRSCGDAVERMTDEDLSDFVAHWTGWDGDMMWSAYFPLGREIADEYHALGWSPSMAQTACVMDYPAKSGPSNDIEMMRAHAMSRHTAADLGPRRPLPTPEVAQ